MSLTLPVGPRGPSPGTPVARPLEPPRRDTGHEVGTVHDDEVGVTGGDEDGVRTDGPGEVARRTDVGPVTDVEDVVGSDTAGTHDPPHPLRLTRCK